MTCVICLDHIKSDRATLVNCGHVFHRKCLTRWIDQAGRCPTCQAEATRSSIIKLFFEESDNHVDVNEVLRKYEKLKDKLKLKMTEIEVLNIENDEMRKVHIDLHHQLISYMLKNDEMQKELIEYEKLKTAVDDRIIEMKRFLLQIELQSRAVEPTETDERKKAKKRKHSQVLGTIFLNDSPPSSPSMKRQRKTRTIHYC